MRLFKELQHEIEGAGWVPDCRPFGTESVFPRKYVAFFREIGTERTRTQRKVNSLLCDANILRGPAGGLSDLPAEFSTHPIIQKYLVARQCMAAPAVYLNPVISDRMIFGTVKQEGNELFFKGICWHELKLQKNPRRSFPSPAGASYTSSSNRSARDLGTVRLHPLSGRPLHGDKICEAAASIGMVAEFRRSYLQVFGNDN